MKKFLQNFKMWMVALVAMFAGTAFAQTPDATFSFASDGAEVVGGRQWTSGDVAVTATNWDGGTWGIGVNLYGGDLTATWGVMKVECATNNIEKIVFHGAMPDLKTVGEFEGTDSWVGSAAEVTFSCTEDVYLTSIDVYLGESSTGGSTSNYATIVSVNPAEGEISLDDNKYGTSQITIKLDGAWDADVYAEGVDNVAAKGIVFTTPEGDQAAPKALYMWQGADNIAIQFGYPNYAFMTPGTYTLSIPANLNTMGGKGNPAATYTWTVLGPSKFEFGWNDAQAQGTKKEGASEWDPFKTLTGFKINAPEGVVFDHLAEGVKLQTKEYDRETYKEVYTDVEGATVALVDGAVVITLAEAITEQGYYNYVLPEGSIFATDGRFNTEVSFSASVDPYSYFELDLGNEQWQGLEFKTPFNKLVITLPADVAATEVGETFTGSYWKDGNYDLTFNVTSFVQEGQKLTVNFTGGDAVPVSTEDVSVWFGLSFPQGFVKTADEFYLSSSHSVNNNKLVQGEDPEPDANEQTYADWKELVTVTMKAVYDAYEEWPTEDVVGEKPAKVIYDVCNYYSSTSWLFGTTMGFGDDWARAAAYYEGLGSSLEEEYAEALAIWEAYENAEPVSEPEEVTLVEEGVATGYLVDENGDSFSYSTFGVAFERYSDGSFVLPNFGGTSYALPVKMGEYYETYDVYYVVLEDVEGLGYVRHTEGYSDDYVFDPVISLGEDTTDTIYLGDWSYYDAEYDELWFNYLSIGQDAYGYFVVALEEPFETTGINTVIATDSNKVYDLSGRRMVKTQKGLNIVNGKVIIK